MEDVGRGRGEKRRENRKRGKGEQMKSKKDLEELTMGYS